MRLVLEILNPREGTETKFRKRVDYLLQRITLRIEIKNQNTASYNWGSIMHGVLMSKLDYSYVEFLHNNSSGNTFSQYVLPIRGQGEKFQFEWTINLMGEEAISQIGPILENEHQYYLRHKDTVLDVLAVKSNKAIKEEEFCGKYLFDDKSPCFPLIRYLTPSSHKSNGQYCIFPSIELILKNLVQKWNYYAQTHCLDDELAVEDMIKRTRITDYKLRSAKYHLEGIRIPAYIGEVRLGIKGPEPLTRLVNMLLAFSEYSGIGIKTSLGMGACQFER